MAEAPLPPEGQAPAAEAPAEGGGDQFSDLVTNISDGLAMLVDAVGSSGIDPEGASALEGLASQYQSVIQKIMGKASGGGAPAAAGQGVVSEMGGAGGVPASPAGVKR